MRSKRKEWSRVNQSKNGIYSRYYFYHLDNYITNFIINSGRKFLTMNLHDYSWNNRDTSGIRTDRDGHGTHFKSDKGKGDLSRVRREKLTTIEPNDQ